MRFALIILLSALIGFACVKPQSKEPVPIAGFKSFMAFQKANGSDTAAFTCSYEDGDGDLFVSDATEGPNIIIVPYIYNESTQSFVTYKDQTTQDTFRIVASVKQPADGYYKGRSIKGDIVLPMNQFRPNNNVKIFKFWGFLMDTKGNRSNSMSSPAYTVNF